MFKDVLKIGHIGFMTRILMLVNIPIAGYYFFSLLVLTMLSTFNAVLVLRIHHRKVFLKEIQSRV